MSVSFTRRSKVLLALVASMTLGSGLLLGLVPPPMKPPAPNTNGPSLTGLQAQPPATTAPAPAIEPAPPAWQRIVLHESGRSPRTLNELELANDFVITIDGRLEESPRWQSRKLSPPRASDTSEAAGIQITVIGKFDRQEPSDKQMRTLKALAAKLATDYRISSQNVVTRPAANSPGAAFPQRYPF